MEVKNTIEQYLDMLVMPALFFALIAGFAMVSYGITELILMLI